MFLYFNFLLFLDGAFCFFTIIIINIIIIIIIIIIIVSFASAAKCSIPSNGISPLVCSPCPNISASS